MRQGLQAFQGFGIRVDGQALQAGEAGQGGEVLQAKGIAPLAQVHVPQLRQTGHRREVGDVKVASHHQVGEVCEPLQTLKALQPGNIQAQISKVVQIGEEGQILGKYALVLAAAADLQLLQIGQAAQRGQIRTVLGPVDRQVLQLRQVFQGAEILQTGDMQPEGLEVGQARESIQVRGHHGVRAAAIPVDIEAAEVCQAGQGAEIGDAHGIVDLQLLEVGQSGKEGQIRHRVERPEAIQRPQVGKPLQR